MVDDLADFIATDGNWPMLVVAPDGSAHEQWYHGQEIPVNRADQQGRLRAKLSTAVSEGDQLLPAWLVQSLGPQNDDGYQLVRLRGPDLPSGSQNMRDAAGNSWSVQLVYRDGDDVSQQVWLKVKGTELPATGRMLAITDIRGPAGMQEAMLASFAAPGLLLFASMLAYLVAQFLDVAAYHFWRRVTKGKYLWLRNNGSTAISQLVDTVLVNGIFLTWAFGMPPAEVIKVIVAVYLVKLILALIDTPLIYVGVWLAKRRLGLRFHDQVTVDEVGNLALEPSPLQDKHD